MEYSDLNFENLNKSESAIMLTWNEFRDALAKKEFEYNEIDKALNYVFLKQLNDFFEMHDCKKRFTKELRDVFIIRNEVLRGTILKPDETPDYDRFIPKREYITEDNRFSPENVEWLYLAIGNLKEGTNLARNCSIKECKAERNQRFGTCHFQMNSEYFKSKLVDLTIGCKYNWKQLKRGFEQDFDKAVNHTINSSRNIGSNVLILRRKKVEDLTKKWFSLFYAKLLSQEIFLPVDSEKKYMYSPFQCLAMYFKQLGYDGIIYSSVAYPMAKNVVLFDKKMANPCGNIEIFWV